MNVKHIAVWIDQKEALIFHVDSRQMDSTVVHAPQHRVQRHQKSDMTVVREHPADEQHYFHEVARSLEGAEEILVVGPGNAKLGLIKHVHKHEHALEPKIIGVETVDHPTDNQLVAYARHYFKAVDHPHAA